ncbi:MAG: SsrA-binding protein SmpB [Acidimicrobiia bacterium]|nr:SsrA-binding protein SmpB [Acidimicrobiia bacterium]
MARQQTGRQQAGRKVVATNRRARHDYEIVETFECGMVLTGSEIKSIRAGQVQLKDAYAEIRGGEVWLNNVHVAPYRFSREGGHDPERSRKLLLHRREIARLTGKVKESGLTLIPLSVYLANGYAKVELGLAKGRRTVDKRHRIREREQLREMDRARQR